mmetsp:Transcript_60630/g.141237  ORF Transcript_60630/g.141237 Transcript_60630/m.141237 type:complete len:253 (-) Transcript_60630:124-882(-)
MVLAAFVQLSTKDSPPRTARDWAAKVCDNRWMETCIMLLVVCDLLFVATQAAIGAGLLCIGGKVVPHGDVFATPANDVTVRPNMFGVAFRQRALHVEEEVLVCETREGHRTQHILHVCHVGSIAILCTFMLELLIKLWVAPKLFMASWGHKLDLFVVVVSLFIETVIEAIIATHAKERSRRELETLEVVSWLLIFSRTWRVVRIFHAFIEEYAFIQEGASKSLEAAEEENAALRKILIKNNLVPADELFNAK